MSFPKNFMWGSAAASYQIEGAYNEDGKGLNIWDVYSHMPGNVAYNETGDIACDHYHRYKEDVALMKKMGMKNYRFSISWSRVMPHGIGEVNEKGLQFYKNLVDELLANGIEPLVTLFHWDYPYDLYKMGGWLNKESSEWFLEYTKVVVDALSDKVKYWITINEPQCFIGLGYQIGRHAPFLRLCNKDLIEMTHNVLLAHGKATKYIRENAKTTPKIGFAPTGPVFIPENDSPEAIEEARSKSFAINEHSYIFSNAWWGDPIMLGEYPKKAYEIFGEDMPVRSKEDMAIISQPLDFYGANVYYNDHSARDEASSNAYWDGTNQGTAKNTLGWPVAPSALYWSPKFLYERYHLALLITENGIAQHDWIALDGKVHDIARIDFLTRYLREFKKASEDGIDIMGYMHWSIMDNFEWNQGYDERFGLVYVDYSTQERTIKDSGYWFKEVMESNGENL